MLINLSLVTLTLKRLFLLTMLKKKYFQLKLMLNNSKCTYNYYFITNLDFYLE